MSLEINEKPAEHLVEITMSGKLTGADYKVFVPQFEEMIKRVGSLNVLVDMHDLQRWDAGAAWEDMKFGTRHAKDMTRVAVVGSKPWQKWFTKIGSAFIRGPVHYFEQGHRAEAVAWLTK